MKINCEHKNEEKVEVIENSDLSKTEIWICLDCGKEREIKVW